MTDYPTNSGLKRKRLLTSTMFAGLAMLAVPATVAITSLAPSVASAQDYTTGILSGQVQNETGAGVAGATVSVTSDQGVTRSATTDATGSFRIPALSVGGYSATITGNGQTLENQRVTVSPGGATYNFTLSSGAVAEVVVTATRRVQDFNRTDVGLAVDVQDLANRVPIGRSINSAVLLTPGAGSADASIVTNGVRRNQSGVTLSGTSAAESVYYINGMNVTDQRTFLGYADLPFDAIQTVETKTGGYQAEFGRGTGGVINIVTRSGSNEFHGGVTAFWQPNSMRATRGRAYAPGGNNSVGQIVENAFSKAEANEQTIWASGPIVQDHVFFFLLYNNRYNNNWGPVSFTNTTTDNGTYLQTKFNDPRIFGKFDFVLNENHKIEATLFSDSSTTDYNPWNYSKSQQKITGPLNNYFQKSGGLNQIYKYTGVFTDWFTLSALYGKSESDYKDYGPNISQPGVLDYGALRGDNATNGRQGGPFNLEGLDTRTTYRVDGDFYVKLAGDHHIRVGYDREDLTSTAYSAYSGGALYYAYDQASCPPGAGVNGCVELLTFANIGDFEAEQSAWYVQDSWDITDNLNIQLGIRQDVYDYKNSGGQSYIKIDDQFAPRLGFNWDPTGDGVDRIYGSVGDYYLPIALNTSIRASSGEIYTDQYFQTDRSAPCLTANTLEAPNNCPGRLQIDSAGFPTVGAQIGATDYFSPPGGPDPRSVIEQDLKPMYEREFILGYEHRFRDGMFADWTAGVRYIHRELQSTIEDTAIGDAVNRYCVRTGNAACAAVDPNVYPYVLVNPGDGAKVFLDIMGETRTDAAGNPNPAYAPQWINLTSADMALPEVERKYQALEFTFQRPFDGRWGLQGSYTLGHSEGNYEGAVKSDVGQTDTSITQDFDHRANTLNAYGDLPGDRRHTLKVFGTYAPTDKLSIGANFTAQSGRPYGCIGTVPRTVDSLAPDSGTPSGWFCPNGAQVVGAVIPATLSQQLAAAGQPAAAYDNIATPRGKSGTTDATYTVDLNLAYRFMDKGAAGSLVGTFDIFNLFDGDAVTRVVEQGEVRTAAIASGGVKGVRAPFYGMARTYQAPRTVRVGLKYAF